MGELAMIIKTTTQPGRRAEVARLYQELMAPRAAHRHRGQPGALPAGLGTAAARPGAGRDHARDARRASGLDVGVSLTLIAATGAG